MRASGLAAQIAPTPAPRPRSPSIASSVASRTRGALHARGFPGFRLVGRLADAMSGEARRLSAEDHAGRVDVPPGSDDAPITLAGGHVLRAAGGGEDLSDLSDLTDSDLATTDDEDSGLDDWPLRRDGGSQGSAPRSGALPSRPAPAMVVRTKKARGGRGRRLIAEPLPSQEAISDAALADDSRAGDERARKRARKSGSTMRRGRERRAHGRRNGRGTDDAWGFRHLLASATSGVLSRAKTAPEARLGRELWRMDSDLRAAGGAYVSTRDEVPHPVAKSATPEWLLARGMREVQWDGRSFELLTDADGLVFGALVGSPPLDGDGWGSACKGAHELLLALGPTLETSTDHRRGRFKALNAGASFGGGQRVPGCLCHGGPNAEALGVLLEDESFERIAGHQSRGLQIACPKVFAYAHRIGRRLYRRYGERVRRPFRSSVYPTCAFNFGPCTECRRHRDSANSPGIPCAITALGDFDDSKGGHLILYDLDTFVRFPAGSTILILSASLDHGNAPIQRGETRTSFTQYFPGGLVRHTEWKFRTWKQLPLIRRGKVREGGGGRLARLISRFSKSGEYDD